LAGNSGERLPRDGHPSKQELNDARNARARPLVLDELITVMPFYLVCDVSRSMRRDMYDLNEGLGRLRTAILADPVVHDMVQICVMSFSDDAKVLMPIDSMRAATAISFSAEGGTNYGSAFRQLAAVIKHDNRNLASRGHSSYRPCAFFVTDGGPADADWHQTFAATLTYSDDWGTSPIFLPFGFRDAPEPVLRQLAYPPAGGKWYHARTTPPEQALREIVNVIIQTVITSGLGAAEGRPDIVAQLPTARSGIVRGDSEFILTSQAQQRV
jgi:uncharacterized protein YegL